MRTHRFARGVVAATALMIAFALGGCGDNTGNPVSYMPEGQPGQAVLLLAPFPDSTLTSVALIATIFAPPPTDGFRLYMQPDNLGFRPATEAPVPATFTLASGWSVYIAVVEGYDPAIATQVVARGARGGIESVQSTLTNTAVVPASDILSLVSLQPITTTQPGDSTVVGTAAPTLSWNALPGASTYLVQVFNSFGGLHYAALSTSNVHQYGVGPGVIFEAQPLINGLYRWNVQAFDGGYRVFGVSYGERAFFVSLPPP